MTEYLFVVVQGLIVIWSCCPPTIQLFQSCSLDDANISHSVSDIQHSRRRWKCSAHLLWTCEVSPILLALQWLCLSSPSLFIYHVLPTSYGLVRFCCSVAFSDLVARAMKQSFLLSLFNCQCLDVRSVFLACSSQTFMSSFRHFLLVIKDYLSLDIHSSRLLALLPKTSSLVSCHIFFSLN